MARSALLGRLGWGLGTLALVLGTEITNRTHTRAGHRTGAQEEDWVRHAHVRGVNGEHDPYPYKHKIKSMPGIIIPVSGLVHYSFGKL